MSNSQLRSHWRETAEMPEFIKNKFDLVDLAQE